LTSQPLGGADRQLKRVELKFAVPKDGRIVELSLAKLNGKNLMAVVKIKRDDEYDFHCLTFIGPWNGGHIRDRFGFHQVKFLITRDELKILAVGGWFESPCKQSAHPGTLADLAEWKAERLRLGAAPDAPVVA